MSNIRPSYRRRGQQCDDYFSKYYQILQIHEGHGSGDPPSEAPWINLVSLIIASFHFLQTLNETLDHSLANDYIFLLPRIFTGRLLRPPKRNDTRQCDGTLLVQLFIVIDAKRHSSVLRQQGKNNKHIPHSFHGPSIEDTWFFKAIYSSIFKINPKFVKRR